MNNRLLATLIFIVFASCLQAQNNNPLFVFNNPCTAINLSCHDNISAYNYSATFGHSEIWYTYNSFATTGTCTPSVILNSTGKIVLVEVYNGPCTEAGVGTSTLVFSTGPIFSISTTNFILSSANLPAGNLFVRVIFSMSGMSSPTQFYLTANAANDPPCVVCNDSLPCKDCMGSFIPEIDKDYIISAWVREESASASQTAMLEPYIRIEFPYSILWSITDVFASGDVIDGWQKMYYRFKVPTDGNNIKISLKCTSGTCLFDDVRVFPATGMMKSYVYDAVNMRFVAELDEQNYASFYEYDEEGKLTTVKKETERGVMTIKESRSKTIKK